MMSYLRAAGRPAKKDAGNRAPCAMLFEPPAVDPFSERAKECR
jgi:hypothetical protein